jgi:hypothetical protein
MIINLKHMMIKNNTRKIFLKFRDNQNNNKWNWTINLFFEC